MGGQAINRILMNIYQRLLDYYGPQYWWPAQEPFEVIVGAILTQSAAWINVEKAIANLKAAGALSPVALRQLSHSEIARLIYPCGYYNSKAHKLKAFTLWLGEQYGDNLDKLFTGSINRLRQQLLGIYGIGEETADSIILYAAEKPTFVIDAYTRRIVNRIGLAPQNKRYTDYQVLFMSNLPPDTQLFNEYHALLVRLAKNTCQSHPLCQQCCLNSGDKISRDLSSTHPCSAIVLTHG
jgi:endonuclease-3 related protein